MKLETLGTTIYAYNEYKNRQISLKRKGCLNGKLN